MADQTPWPIVPGHYWTREGPHSHEMARVILSGKLTLYTISGHPATPATFPNVVWGARILSPEETGDLAQIGLQNAPPQNADLDARVDHVARSLGEALGYTPDGVDLAAIRGVLSGMTIAALLPVPRDYSTFVAFVAVQVAFAINARASGEILANHGDDGERVEAPDQITISKAMACIKDLVGVYGATTVSAWATAAGIEGRGEEAEPSEGLPPGYAIEHYISTKTGAKKYRWRHGRIFQTNPAPLDSYEKTVALARAHQALGLPALGEPSVRPEHIVDVLNRDYWRSRVRPEPEDLERMGIRTAHCVAWMIAHGWTHMGKAKRYMLAPGEPMYTLAIYSNDVELITHGIAKRHYMTHWEALDDIAASRGEPLVCDDLSADSSSCTRTSSEPRCLGCPSNRLARVRFVDDPEHADGGDPVGEGPDVLALVRKLANGQALLARDVEGIGQADRAIFENLERMLNSIGALADSLAELRGEAIKVEDAEDTMIGRMFARLMKIDPEWIKAQEQAQS